MDFVPWGFQPQPVQPRAPRRYLSPTMSVARGPARFTSQWGFQPNNPQPPRRRCERVAASLLAPLNIERRFEKWTNAGWTPTLPVLLRRVVPGRGAIVPLSRIDSPFVPYLRAGWQQTGGWTPRAFRRYLPPMTTITSGGTVTIPAPLPPWVGQIPMPLARPRLALMALAGRSQFASFDALRYGWQPGAPQLRYVRRYIGPIQATVVGQ